MKPEPDYEFGWTNITEFKGHLLVKATLVIPVQPVLEELDAEDEAQEVSE